MTATAHALIGASLALKIANPIIGIPAAIFSHFVADLVPHWDAGTNHRKKTKWRLRAEAAADVLLGFALVIIIFRTLVEPKYLFAMVIAAQLPDWLEAPSWMFGVRVPYYTKSVEWLSHNLQTRMQLPWGLVTQVVTVGLLILYSLGGPYNFSQTFAAGF